MNTLTTVKKGVTSHRIINGNAIRRIQSRLRQRQGSLLSRHSHSHDRTFVSSQAQAKAKAKGAALKQQLQQNYKYHYDRGVAPIAAYAALCAVTIATCTISNSTSEQQQPPKQQNQQENLHQQSEPQSIVSKSVSLLQIQTGMCQCESVAASNSSSSLNVKVNRTNTQLPNENVNANTSTTDDTNDDTNGNTNKNTNENTNITNKNTNSSQPRNVMLHRLRSIRSRSLADKYDVDWKTVLGEGAYGSVHPARLLATGEKVALKKITKRYTDTSSFSRETDALLRIYHNGGHPNISGMRDMYEDYDHFYLVMDLVSGGEMFDHLIEYGAYSEADAARLMSEVSSALAFLHGVGVVHADLKPENLLLCSRKRLDGTIKMIDFGCAVVEKDQYSDDDDHNDNDDDKKSVGVVEDDKDDDGGDDKIEESSNDTESGKGSNSGSSGSSGKDPKGVHRTLQSWIEALNKKVQEEAIPVKAESTGTTAYWPPERFNSPRSPDHAADMWAVGVILFIMLTGVHPFDLTGVATDAAIAEQIKKDPSPPITQGLTGHLSPSAINLIKMLLDKNPADRLTANEMLEHPWIVGDEASTEVIKGSAEKLGKFRDLRAIIEAGIFSILIEKGSKEMAMSEYTPKMVYKDDRRGSSDTSKRAPASSVLKRAFEVFDQGGKGFVSADDLNRVVTETTGQSLSDSEKNEMINPFNTDTAGSSGLSLSSFSKVAAGLKHKHFPRGHIVFRAGEIGDAMYFINSGKVEIQTKKGQLIHILRHGDFFGEGSLLDEDNRRFSTAKCATPVDLIKIKQSEFKR